MGQALPGGDVEGTSEVGGDLATVAYSAMEGAIDGAASAAVSAEEAASRELLR